MSDYEFTLPVKIILPRVKTAGRPFYVNMNTFTGIKPFTYNNAKETYRDLMKDQLTSVEPADGKITIIYEYYAKANNSPDLDNFVSAGIKFFQDAMVNHGFIEDDNVHFIPAYSVKYAGIDRKNPRIVAKITVLDE